MRDRPPAGLLDTSAVIDLDELDATTLPDRLLISSITLAELAAGPIKATNPEDRALRLEKLQATEATFDPVPFDNAAARAFGRVYAAVLVIGRQPRGRLADLQIAAVALALDLPVVTRNPDDLRGLEKLLEVIAV